MPRGAILKYSPIHSGLSSVCGVTRHSSSGESGDDDNGKRKEQEEEELESDSVVRRAGDDQRDGPKHMIMYTCIVLAD